jgi:predicted RNA polymerase sigma factor
LNRPIAERRLEDVEENLSMAKEAPSKASAHVPDPAPPDNPAAAVEQHGDEPAEDRIRERAHQIWVEEGKPEGRSMDHWLRAHWELKQK